MSAHDYEIPPTTPMVAEQENGAAIPLDEPPSDAVELDRWIGRKLRKIAGLRAQQNMNAVIAQSEIERYTQWRDGQNKTLESSIGYHEEQLRMVALTYDFRDKRSRTLADGTFGFRKSGGRLLITDQDAAVAFAREHDIPVKVVESVASTSMREYVQSTGTVPEFVQIEEAVDSFYVRIDGGAQ